ncbi:P-selectin isoform X2 [Spea bombifrons]|uniref:P-selectin isoform X2 n=1 Tax=Spea bombifrons TaxID=233779 RepID=UPI002348F3C8|nr:P-selectin isoform X2 [Spea bombifrons]
MESKKDYTLWGRTGCCWKSLNLLYFAAVSCGLLKGVEVSAWTYHVGPDLLTWDTARTWCRTHYTDMVAIQNKEEISYLEESLPFSKDYYWIGIRKVNQVWTWVGTNKSLTKDAENWAPLEPNNKGRMQDCVEMYIKRQKDNGKWNDEPCNNKKTALCYLANCNASSCSQDGMCVEIIGNYTCDCNPGFYGRHCERVITCKNIYPVPKEVNINCSHTAGQFAYKSSCSFQCNDGFQLRGASTLQCSEHGNWTTDIPECEAVSCKSLQRPTNGLMKCSHTFGIFQYNSNCSFHCEEGFLLQGPESVLCRASGEWSDLAPTCAVVACLAPEIPDYAWTNCSHPINNFSYTSICKFNCESGFILNGSDIMECTSSGEWNFSPPACQAVSCKSLQRPPNGLMKCSHTFGIFQYNSNCSFHCEEGFLLQGPESVLCQASGDWSDLAPTCAVVTCLAPEIPDYAWTNCSHPIKDFSYTSICKFNCESGFLLNGSHIIECTSSGEWNFSPPACQAVSCKSLQRPTNGVIQCSHTFDIFQYNSNCSFHCEEGFLLQGPESVLCQASGDWSDLAPTCAVVACLAPELPDYAWTNCSHPINNFSYTSVCKFNCESGFILNGSDIMECTSSGEWNFSPPTCQAASCLVPELPYHAGVNCSHPISNFSFMSVCEFSCEPGFSLNGPKLIQCTSSGKWDSSPPVCSAIKCGQLSTSHPRHMNCSDPYGNYSYGSQCQFLCLEDFVLNGTSMIYCQSSGYWSDEMPNCHANVFSLGRQLLSYLGSSVLATIFFISTGTLIAFTVNRIKQKKKSGLLKSHKVTPNTFDNPVFESP